jgi:hypothetical protein
MELPDIVKDFSTVDLKGNRGWGKVIKCKKSKFV